MHIHCPSCAAVYDLPVILLTAARTMRCAVCAQDWQTTAIDPETAQAMMRDAAREVSAPAAPTPIAEAAQALAAAAAQVVTQVAAQMLAAPPGAEDIAPAAPATTPDIAAAPDIAAGPEAEATRTLAPDAAPPAPGFPAPGLPAPGLPAPPQRQSRLAGLRHGAMPAALGWAFSLGILFVCGQAVLQHRAGITTAWPASRRLFLWLGLS